MKGVQVPSSVPQLTTKEVLTMSFVDGQPITRLKVDPETYCFQHKATIVMSQPYRYALKL